MLEKKPTKNITRKMKAASSIELSLTMTMVTAGVILILALFGHNLASAFLQSTFPNHFAPKEDISQTLVNNDNNTAFAQTQIDVAVTASQGIKFNTEAEASKWVLSTASNVLAMDAPAQFDVESLAKAATMADRMNITDIPTKSGTLAKAQFKKTINTDKYGNIMIKTNSATQELTTTANGKTMTVKIGTVSKNDVIALINAIYTGEFK